MRLEPVATFRDWASTVGIEVEEHVVCEGRFQHSLRFRSPGAEDRYWITPYESKPLLIFITALLDAVWPWEFCWTLKREGRWDDRGDGDGLEPVLRSLGIPPHFDGAIRFDTHERPALALLMAAQIAFGWCGYYDIWVVPSHGRYVIQTDDDEVTYVGFLDKPTLDQVVQHMNTRGFQIPEEPPHERFSWLPWMGPKPPDWKG